MMFGTFFTITPEHMTTMLGYISDFIADFTPILLPIIAISLGLLVIWAIIKAIR